MADFELDPAYQSRFSGLPPETQNIIKHYLMNAKSGRPCKLKPEMLPKLLVLCAEGATKAQICASLGFSIRTLDRLLADKLKNESLLEHIYGEDGEKSSLLQQFRLVYKFGRTLAQSFFDQIARTQLISPDKAFNDRLFVAQYKRMFANNSDSPIIEAMPELMDAIEEDDMRAMNTAVLKAVASGKICTETAESLVSTLKRVADLTVYDELQARLEDLENNGEN